MEIPRPIIIPSEPYRPGFPASDDEEKKDERPRSRETKRTPTRDARNRRSPLGSHSRSPLASHASSQSSRTGSRSPMGSRKSGRSPGGGRTSPGGSTRSPLGADGSYAQSASLGMESMELASLSILDLTDAVNTGDVKGVNMVIDALILDMIINHQDGRGMTPLHLAVKKGFEDVVLNLLHRGADVHRRDAMGWSPLFWATIEGHIDLVKLLISRGSDVTDVDDSGATLLHFAALEGHTELVQMFLDMGVDVKRTDNFGATAIQRACMQGHEETALLLMEAGADFQLPEGTSAESLPPLAQAALLFCEDFGFPSHLRRKETRDAQTWTKEDGVLEVISSDSDISDNEEEGVLQGDKKSLGSWFKPLDQRSGYSLKSGSKGATRSTSVSVNNSVGSVGSTSVGHRDSMLVGELAFGSVEGTPRGSAPGTARSESSTQVDFDRREAGVKAEPQTSSSVSSWFSRGSRGHK